MLWVEETEPRSRGSGWWTEGDVTGRIHPSAERMRPLPDGRGSVSTEWYAPLRVNPSQLDGVADAVERQHICGGAVIDLVGLGILHYRGEAFDHDLFQTRIH